MISTKLTSGSIPQSDQEDAFYNETPDLHERSQNVVPNCKTVSRAIPMGFTYFVRDGDMIKIGSSMRPEERIANLQTGAARQLEVLAIIPQEIAEEHATHQLFAHLRVRGEWFHADQELLYFVDGLKAAPPAVPDSAAPAALPDEPTPAMQAQAMIRGLHALRKAHGSDTPMGHAASNLAEIIPALATYERPAWATHECQTLPYMAMQQIKRIERFKATAN